MIDMIMMIKNNKKKKKYGRMGNRTRILMGH